MVHWFLSTNAPFYYNMNEMNHKELYNFEIEEGRGRVAKN